MQPAPKLGDLWYRYWDGQDCIELSKLTVVRVTAKCVYLYESPGEEPFDSEYIKKHSVRVLQAAERRYAYPTEELAARSYRIRKSWQRRHLTTAMERLELMESLMGKDGKVPEASLKPPVIFNQPLSFTE